MRNPNNRWKHTLKSVYGVTPEWHALTYAEQNGRCASCFRPMLCRGRIAGTLYAVIDHDHKTGAVRGLLCNNCNAALGMLNEDEEMISGLLAYVRRTKS